MKHTNVESIGHPVKEATEHEHKHKLTVLQSVYSGSVSGAVEVLVNHPLWSIKTQMQSGESLTFNPKVLYRGLFLNTASMAPITAMQVGLNRCFQTLFFNDASVLSETSCFISAFAAGVGSSFFCCPTEMIITNQKTHGTRFHTSAQRIMKQGGVASLYSGLLATMLREGLFTAFFLAVSPALKEKIKVNCPNDYAASLFAGMIAGVGATCLSQGVDTIKTVQQTSIDSSGFWQTTKKIHSLQGVPGFFKGSIPRGARVISAVTLMGFINEKMEMALSL